jgi:cytidine deaminase
MLSQLTADDRELVTAARRITTDRFEHGRHYVGTAVRTGTDDVVTAIHMEANVSRATVCAEPIALGKAVSAGYDKFETIVSVRHPAPTEDADGLSLVAPCGVCRELISDYAPDADVIHPATDGDEVEKSPISDLIPYKYRTSYRATHLDR